MERGPAKPCHTTTGKPSHLSSKIRLNLFTQFDNPLLLDCI